MSKQYTNYKNIKKLGLAIICFDASEHLYNIISELRQSVDYVSVGLQKVSYHGDRIQEIDLQEIYRLRDEDKLIDKIVDVELDISKEPRVQETDKRNLLIQDAQNNGCTHCIVIDSDEYYTRKSFEDACRKIDENDYEITYCQYINYYHDYQHFLVYPFKEGMYVPFVTKVKYRHSFECTDFPKPSDPTRRFVRPYKGERTVLGANNQLIKVKNYTVNYHIFEWNEVKMHHLSWLRADIRKKLNVWSSKTCFENYNDLIDRAVDCFEEFNPNSTQAKALMLFNTPGNSVDVKAFPKQYIHPKEDFNTRLRPVKDYKKILVLTMSADLPLFNELEKVSNETWRNIDTEKYKNIDIEFWTYTDADYMQETYVDKDKHIIYIKRTHQFKESEGYYKTFSKTIYALQELNKLGIKYDYLLRTNNSTWINLPMINEFLAWQNDDSQIFTGRIYSSFWSAFNLYAGGELMIFSKRNIDILLKLSEKPEDYEKRIPGCDDNLLFGLWNKRLLNLQLTEHKYLHSFDDEMCIEKELPYNIDFTKIAYQVKTYLVSDEDRLTYDVNKMKQVDEMWRKCDVSLDELYNKLMEQYYDKFIYIIPYSKQDWFKLKDEDQHLAKFKNRKDRKEGIEYASKRQVELGYYKAKI